MEQTCINCENRGLGFVCVECKHFNKDNKEDLWMSKSKFKGGDFEYEINRKQK